MRHAPLAMTPDEFRSLGHRLVDRIAEHLRTLPERPVTHGEPPSDVRDALGASRRIPDKGEDGAAALLDSADLLFDHSTFNGHPRFLAYITSSPAPLGMLFRAQLLKISMQQFFIIRNNSQARFSQFLECPNHRPYNSPPEPLSFA